MTYADPFAPLVHSHARRLRGLTGEYIGLLPPGSEEWRARMSASKVASVVGLSPYSSRFATWHEMAGTVTRDDESAAMARGTYLEPAIAAWFADQHPDWKIIPTGTWQHPQEPWAIASPDRLAIVPREPVRLVEIKTAAHADEWGTAGTDQIPPGYRCQVVWSMLVTGARRTHVAVLLPFLELREYVVDYDEDEAQFLLQECGAFMHDLAHGIAPALDGTDATYRTLRDLHPDIDDVEVEVDPITAEMWLIARAELDDAKETEQLHRARLVETLGNGRKATANGYPLGSRMSKNGGTPYFTPARSLPTPEQVLTSRKDTA